MGKVVGQRNLHEGGCWRNCKKISLEKLGLEFKDIFQLGPIELNLSDPEEIERNPFFCAEPQKLEQLESFMESYVKRAIL